MVNESLQSLSSLYITSCGIEGKSPETLRFYAETLKLFMRTVERLGLPDDPGLFRPGDVYEFLGDVRSPEHRSLRNHTVEAAARDACLLLMAHPPRLHLV